MIEKAAPEPENFAGLSPLKHTQTYDSQLRRSNQARFSPKPFSMKTEELVYTRKHTKTVPFQFTSDKKTDEKNSYEHMSVYKRNELEYLSEI